MSLKPCTSMLAGVLLTWTAATGCSGSGSAPTPTPNPAPPTVSEADAEAACAGIAYRAMRLDVESSTLSVRGAIPPYSATTVTYPAVWPRGTSIEETGGSKQIVLPDTPAIPDGAELVEVSACHMPGAIYFQDFESLSP